jgi:predicted glycoside hydrolase/deacetylase ChbG (UPF0249 family)
MNMQEEQTASRNEKIIVSADDFGMREVADAVLVLARIGKVDRVAVVTRFFDTPKMLERAKALLETGVKIDVHLELMDLIKSGNDPNESALRRGLNFCVRYGTGRVRVSDVERAWTEQIEKFREIFGRFPDGLNSHEHVHFFPGFFNVALSLAQRFDIPFVRFGRLGVASRGMVLAARVIALFRKGNIRRYLAKTPIFETTDYFASYDWLRDAEKSWTHFSQSGATVEIVFHVERLDEYDFLLRHR